MRIARVLSPRSLRTQLLGALLAVLLLLLTVMLSEGLRDRRLALQQARQDTLYLTLLSLRDLETDFGAAEQLLSVLADLPEVQAPLSPACDARLAELIARERAYLTFGVALPSGVVACASRPIPQDATVTDREWFRQAVAGSGVGVGSYEVGAVSRQPVLTLGVPVERAGGERVGVVFAALPSDFAHRLQENLRLPDGAALTLFDRRGIVLARFPNTPGFAGRRSPESPVTRAVLAGREGTEELVGLDGVRRVYSFTPLRVGENVALYAAAGLASSTVYARANETLRLYTLVVLGLGMALLALAVVVGQRVIFAPLNALRGAVGRLAGGDLRARARLQNAPRELEELAASFNALAASLEGRMEENRQLTRDLERRVEERTAQLVRTNEALETFAHSIAHDLRSPLRTIHGFTELVLARAGGLTERERADLRRVLATARRMDELIRDLLAFSRVAREVLPLEEVDLAAAVRDVLADLTAEVERSGAEVRVEGEWGAVRGNGPVVRQVLLNLVSNALKFTRPGEAPRVRLWAERVGNEVRVNVQDQGLGIRPADQGRVFEVFGRLHLPGEYPGTGIGLALVRLGVERLGGQVGVESEEGVGSRFWFTLPAGGTPVEARGSEGEAAEVDVTPRPQP